MPPLRDRPEDIPALIDSFIQVYRQRFNRPALDVSPDARERLQEYSWPGNIRELRNFLERAAAISTNDIIDTTQIPFPRTSQSAGAVGTAVAAATPAAPMTLDELEREHILRVLQTSAGNRERAAAILGISSRTLYRKIREYETDTASSGLATED